MKSSGNTLFHICFANKSSVTTLLYASASFCDGHLRLAFISKFNYIISATTGSSQSTNVSQISPTLRWRCFATALRTTCEGFTTLSSKKRISISERPSFSANGFHLSPTTYKKILCSFINCVTIEKTDFGLKQDSTVDSMVNWHKLLTFSWRPNLVNSRLFSRVLFSVERRQPISSIKGYNQFMKKWVCGRQPNSSPERLNVKSLYCLCGMQPTDISSFNNGPVETNKQKKICSRMYLRILKTKTNIYIYILKQIQRASTANTTSQ